MEKIMKNIKTEKQAFTLAEVLITLGIIGVVAALTIPSLIKTHQEKVTVNKVKKMYSTLNQALRQAINDYGEVSLWDLDGGGSRWSPESAENFWNNFKTYLKVAKEYQSGEECPVGSYKYLNNSSSTGIYGASNDYKKVILNDGSLLWIRTHGKNCQYPDGKESDVCAIITYDVNGVKAPNTIGIDAFSFRVKSNTIVPNTDDCSLESNGWGCSAYILHNGNMNYLHKK